MTAQALASALEGKREGHEWRARCPVHGGRSLCIRERAGKVLVVCRAGCSQSNIIRALREMCLWGNVSCLDIQLPPGPEPENDMDRRIRKAEKMWDESHPIESGDPVHKYLTGRGIVIDTWPDDLHTRLTCGCSGESERRKTTNIDWRPTNADKNRRRSTELHLGSTRFFSRHEKNSVGIR